MEVRVTGGCERHGQRSPTSGLRHWKFRQLRKKSIKKIPLVASKRKSKLPDCLWGYFWTALTNYYLQEVSLCCTLEKQFVLWKRWLWRDLKAAFQFLQGGHQEDRARLLMAVFGQRTWPNRHKLNQERITFSPWGQSDIETGSQNCLRCLCSWIFSCPDCIKPWKPSLISYTTLLWAASWTTKTSWGPFQPE